MSVTVKQKQALLLYLGYYVGNVDGDWGQLSKTACKAFQKDHGLQADGVFGEDTAKAARAAVSADEVKKTEEAKAGDFWDEIEFFEREEFRCKCGGKYCNGFAHEPKEAMVRLADGARRHFGRPATVISGLRCPQHNANEGGVDNSQHIYGEACDIQIPGVSANTLLAYFQSQPGVRYAYAINATNVHFDIPKGDR